MIMAGVKEGADRPRKIAKVSQNHKVIISSINTTNMDHYCKIVISPDRMNPNGCVKQGIRLHLTEFSRGLQVLGERCNYRLLSPLSSHQYKNYLEKATEEYLQNRDVNAPDAKPVIEVFNHTPFPYKNRNFTCINGDEVFEIFNNDQKEKGFARQIPLADLPFIVNWSGCAHCLPMQVNDDEVMSAIVEILTCFEELQPNILGLGLCGITEFGRILLYNILVDGERELQTEESEDERVTSAEDIIFSGYKQMVLVLNSQQVETGKSFMAEMLLRIFYGRKVGANGTLSFDSSKEFFRKGEPVVVDDFNNDTVGATLLSRASKAIWGQSTVTLRNKATVPRSNLVICSNEHIRDLKVEGKNKDEIFSKFSVLDLGEEPLVCSDNKGHLLKKILELCKSLRKCFPSFSGLMLQACGKYITREEFQSYSDLTSHERLGNLLKNVKNIFDKLAKFCEVKEIVKPKCLIKLDVSPLTMKSELVHKFKTPEQLSEILISQKVRMVQTQHNDVAGIAFSYLQLSLNPWFKDTLDYSIDGVPVYAKMRSRRLASQSGAEGRRVAFLKFELLKSDTVKRLKEECIAQEPEKYEPSVLVASYFSQQCKQYESTRMKCQQLAVQCILKYKEINKYIGSSDQCMFCSLVCKSSAGLKNHLRKCQKKPQ